MIGLVSSFNSLSMCDHRDEPGNYALDNVVPKVLVSDGLYLPMHRANEELSDERLCLLIFRWVYGLAIKLRSR